MTPEKCKKEMAPSPEYDSVDINTYTATNPRQCCECFSIIPIGGRYEAKQGVIGDKRFIDQTCLPCAEIRDFFFINPIAGQLWDELSYRIFHVGLLDEMSLAAAEKIDEMIELDEYK